MSDKKLAIAAVLADVPSHGLKAGQLVEAAPELIKQLVADGSADANKGAVAYLREQNAPVARSAIELAAEAVAARRAELLVDLAKAEAALATEQPPEVQAALRADIGATQTELAALGG